MKLLITTIVSLAMVSCTSDEDDNSKMISRISGLKDALSRCEETTESLKAKLAFKEAGETFNDSGSSTSSQEEEQESSEPECHDKNYEEIYVNDRLFATCPYDDIETEPCGIKAVNCKGDYSFHCLQNVKLKSITIKVCE